MTQVDVETCRYAEGMTLRDYFAARAPSSPLWLFEVRMPTPRPKPQMEGEGERRHCVNERDVAEWDIERLRQRAIQWPWVWADAMLRERGRQ